MSTVTRDKRASHFANADPATIHPPAFSSLYTGSLSTNGDLNPGRKKCPYISLILMVAFCPKIRSTRPGAGWWSGLQWNGLQWSGVGSITGCGPTQLVVIKQKPVSGEPISIKKTSKLFVVANSKRRHTYPPPPPPPLAALQG